ncbi:oral-facial-digital syndrome 1 protein homolog isoform X2 [Thalassophryne amazonica]|uniref:oral-facial-digital syndrome 1 protein homolog isoform X2 n=1 Tax=Thalassophryne amazonica TaxID=390379 RepID=UPI001470BEBE|nr:oral-facial-digital syndrome 1 protein homolog isoform X2 [Thalassophryne amazonica]
MSAAEEDYLSSDELRKRLLQILISRGVLGALKTQMRSRLIQELIHPDDVNVLRPVSVESESPLSSACKNIVADYLQTSGYEYTLSLFCAESGLGKDQILTKEELLNLLKVSPESSLYRSMPSSRENNKGFLFSFLTALKDHSAHGLYCDADTQTPSARSYGESLVEKMKMVDKEYERLHCSGDKLVLYQTNLSAYRKEFETQLKDEMNTKMQHFKDVEIVKMRMEEQTRLEKEFDKMKKEMERTYELKATGLMTREKNAMDRLQKQQEIEERNVYTQRQILLKEIDTVRNRENELKIKIKAFEKSCRMQEERMKTSEDLLIRKELAVKSLEEMYEQKLKSDLCRYQHELKEEFIKRTQKLTDKENQNKAETARIEKESAVLNAKLEEYKRSSLELSKLKVDLDTAQQQVSLLSQQKELLRERLDSVSDYSSLKREKMEVQEQLFLLKKHLEEAQTENWRLHAELKKPSEQQLALQVELLKLQDARRLDQQEFEDQKRVLQSQLQREVDHCAQLRAELTKNEEMSCWMTNGVEQVEVRPLQPQQVMIYDDDLFEAPGLVQEHSWRSFGSSGFDLNIMAEVKARQEELIQQADTLDEAYRKYQQRAVHSTVSHTLPARPLSPKQVHSSYLTLSPRRKQVSRSPYSSSHHKLKVSPRPLSPGSLSYKSNDGENNLASPQLRVTFSEDQNQPHSSDPFRTHNLQSLATPLIGRDELHQDRSSSPSRRPSTRLHSPTSMKLQTETAEESGASVEQSSDSRFVPAPSDEVTPLSDISCNLSPPLSPRLKSTARDTSSDQKCVLSSSESSPQPEKISLEDLTETLPEPSHIPALLLDTAVPLSQGAPDGPVVPHPQAPADLADANTETQGQADVPQVQSETAQREEKDDEDKLSWRNMRKEREERRKRETEEAKEKELQELERLEKEMLLQAVKQPGQEVEESGITEGDDEQKEEVETEEMAGEKLLEKYMKLALKVRENQRAQISGREDVGHTSAEAKSPSEEKDDSIAAYSHEAVDDDSW